MPEIFERILEAYGIPNERGWQVALAEKTGVKKNVVSAWKKRGIPERIISNVALETNYSKAWIKTGEGEMRGSPPSRGHSYPAEKSLTKEEQKLLNSYRAATPEIQKAAGTMLENSAIESRRSAGGGSDLQAEKLA